MKLFGIWNRPYLDLTPHLDLSGLDDLDDEICLGLTRVEPSYTGGSLKWMGVVAPHVQHDPYADYMRVIEGFSRDELARFVSLADDPDEFDLDHLEPYRFGDETDHPLNVRQMMFLKFRYGVYFPWKVAFHFVENERWEDKHLGEGKGFTEKAVELFPRTVALLKRLPFREIGRALVFGLEANDHAPLHRDTAPGTPGPIGHSISICPRGNKRFFLADPSLRERTYVSSKAYWFNDMDYHGVEADPFFRYSIRVDGVFDPTWIERLERHVKG